MRVKVCTAVDSTTPPPHLSASESAGFWFQDPALGDNDCVSWWRGVFKPHFAQVPGPFGRACNLETKHSWRSEPCEHGISIPLAVIDLPHYWAASPFLVSTAIPAKVRFNTCMYPSRGPCVFDTSSVVFLWERLRGDGLDVRRWRESFSQFSVHVFYINLMQG